MCVVCTFAYLHSPLPPFTFSPLLGFLVRGEKHQEDDQEEKHRPGTIPGLAMFSDFFLSPGYLLGVMLIEPGPECVEFCFNGSKYIQFRLSKFLSQHHLRLHRKHRQEYRQGLCR